MSGYILDLNNNDVHIPTTAYFTYIYLEYPYWTHHGIHAVTLTLHLQVQSVSLHEAGMK